MMQDMTKLLGKVSLTLEISMDNPSILNNKRRGRVCIGMLVKVI